MSLDIKHVTNGKEVVYVVFNTGISPPTMEIYKERDDVPIQIRDYAEEGIPSFYGPDISRIVGRFNGVGNALLDYLWPNHPDCKLFGRKNNFCIAESCIHAPDSNWQECKYLDV